MLRLACWIGIHKTRRARRWHDDLFVCAECKRCRCTITIAVIGGRLGDS